MKRLGIGLLCAALAGMTASAAGFTGHDLFFWKPRPKLHRFQPRDRSFNRIATFANYTNNPSRNGETVSEIIAATADGRRLVYTDSEMFAVGFIDIANPRNPQPLGKFNLPEDHEPTSVDVLGNTYALVSVNTSGADACVTPPALPRCGYLAVLDISSTPSLVREIDLGGQPDAVKISPDGKYAAITIENERDEDVNDGELPQDPPGYLAVIRLAGAPAGWTRADVDLTGLSAYAPTDPEPEFVDVNSRNQAVVTMQENNHIAIVDLESLTVIRHFPAGTVDLNGVDATFEEDVDSVISLTESLENVPREPDAVVWVPSPGGREHVATANEGDLFGGSRGFSIFRTNGTVAFDSGTSLEEIAVQHGHYPEDRSDNTGIEPEGLAYGRYGHEDFLFIGSERGGFVAVYELNAGGQPKFRQLLPAGVRPEGILTIPHRNLLIASGEEDDDPLGVRSTVMIFELQRGEPQYPQIVSDDDKGSPIPWSALSGMVSVPGRWDTLLAVWDGFYTESRIFRIDVSEKPAVITDAITIHGGTGNHDPEGIAIAPDGSLWVATEGDANDVRRNQLLKLNRDGQVLQQIDLPQAILDCRAASTSRGTLGSGFEGVAVIRDGRRPGDYRLIVAQQRGWNYTTPECEDLDDDAGGFIGSEPKRTRLWIYDPSDRSWNHIAWELQPKPVDATWVGLSEITATLDGDFVLIERDNRTGDFGVLKTLVRIDRRAAADDIITNGEKSVFDLRPALLQSNGWITDKPEGVAITPDGRTYVVTDNDGVDGWSGETWFLNLGRYWQLFR